MTGGNVQKFDNDTAWDVWRKSDGIEGWSQPGWAMPSDHTRYISPNDGYWGHVLDNARQTYGDPHIHYNTDSIGQQRYLVFHDGTRLPATGSVVYHDAEQGKNWLQNTDGTVTPADKDFLPNGPAVAPMGYRRSADGKSYLPVDARGHQIGASRPFLPGMTLHGNQADPNAILTPVNADGSYYTLDPATGRRCFFDKNGKPITEEHDNTARPPSHTDPATPPDRHHDVGFPQGMAQLDYPQWALDTDSHITDAMSQALVLLYEMFGSGTPDTSGVPSFPFNPQTGGDRASGIDNYDTVKKGFIGLANEFASAAETFNTAIKQSAEITVYGRDAINQQISRFNTHVKALPKGSWDKLLGAEVDLITNAQKVVAKAASTQHTIGQNPDPIQPGPSTAPAANASGEPTNPRDVLGPLTGLGSSLPLPTTNPGVANPLATVPGLLGNGLGGLGANGSGVTPLASTIGNAVKPLSRIGKNSNNDDDSGKPKIKPLGAPKTDAPATGAGAPGIQPPPPTTSGGGGGRFGGSGGGPNPQATVTHPDGKIYPAPNKIAAHAAENALTDDGGGGDPAQKAYAGTGVDIASDGKNPGAKIDPGDQEAGDIIKWKHKTMVGVGPGLVADPTNPGHVLNLHDVLKDSKGFVGIFRPTQADPLLTAHVSPTPPDTAPPPPEPPHVSAPPPPPPQPGPGPAAHPPAAPAHTSGPAAAPAAVPVAGHGDPPPQAAPPSPFPAPKRTTKADRIAAGQQ